MKTTCRGRAIVVQGHILDFTTTIFSNLVQQKPVDRTADTKSKHTCVWMFLHFRNDLLAVADFRVSNEANNSHVSLRIGRIECSLNRLHHLRSAVSRTGAQKVLCFLQILRCRRDWLGKKYASVAGKGDQVESIGGIEIVERKLHRLLGLFNGKATHRTGGVEHKHQLLRHDVFHRHSLRWLQNHCEETASPGTMG